MKKGLLIILFCLYASLVFAEPINYFSDVEDVGTQKQLTILSYPKYYNDNGFKEVDTNIESCLDPDWDWQIVKGVYKTRIKNDGTFEINHLEDIFSIKLLGLGFFNTQTKEKVIKTNLSLSNPTVNDNEISWSLPLGCSYKLIYIHDTFKDILVLSQQAKNWLKDNKPSGWTAQNTWIGLIYDCDLSQSDMIESKDFETDGDVNFNKNNKTRHKLKKAYVKHNTTNDMWTKKRFYKNGKYVEAIPVSALESVDGELIFNTDVSFQEGHDYAAAVTASDTGTDIWYGVDGNEATQWLSGSSMATNEYYKIDLGANITVDEYRLYTNSGTDWPQDYHLEYSTNDSDWNLAYDIANAGDGDDTTTFTEQTARYWRIRCEANKGNWWRINEFELNNNGSRVESSAKYTGCVDSHLREGATGNNMGAHTVVEICRYIGASDSDDKNTVMKFDISSIPSSATVSTANLKLYFDTVRNGSSATKTINASQLKRDWGEGIGLGVDGQAANAGEVTWASAKHGSVTWTTGGALDTTNDIYASETSQAVDETVDVWITWAIPTMTQSWVTTAATNYGVLLYESSPSTDNGAKDFRSRQYVSDVSTRPLLEVSYTVAAGVIKTLNGLVWASVKTFNGLAVGSIKTINGAAAQ